MSSTHRFALHGGFAVSGVVAAGLSIGFLLPVHGTDTGAGFEEAALINEGRTKQYLEQLKLRGIFEMGLESRFTLHDLQEDRVFTLTKDEGRYGVKVVAFDAKANALTISHGGVRHTLHLEASDVADLRVEAEDEIRKFRERWVPSGEAARRERIREYRAVWFAALEESREIREIDEHLTELIAADRRNRNAMEAGEPGTPEYKLLRDREARIREELELLSRFGMMEMRRNSVFADVDVEALHRMTFRIDPKPGEGRSADGLFGDYIEPFP